MSEQQQEKKTGVVLVADTAQAERDRIMREAILEGSKDPDNYKMPDGRTLTETRRAIEEAGRKEAKMLTVSTNAAMRAEGLQGVPHKDKVKFVTDPKSGVLLTHPVHSKKQPVRVEETSQAAEETTDETAEEQVEQTEVSENAGGQSEPPTQV